MTIQELQQTKKPVTSVGPLAAVLAALDIPILATPVVERYKAVALQTKMDELSRGLREIPRAIWGDYEISVREDLLLAGWDMNAATVRFYYTDRGIREYLILAWQREAFGLSAISADVPDFVQRKMTQIAERVPEVTFATDTLRDRRGFYDPLASVTLGKETYYFEVWGEDLHP